MTYEPILHALQELVQRRVASNLPPADSIKKAVEYEYVHGATIVLDIHKLAYKYH